VGVVKLPLLRDPRLVVERNRAGEALIWARQGRALYLSIMRDRALHVFFGLLNAPRTSALESQHRLIQLTQHATQKSFKKYTWRHAKKHSAQPEMLWRGHHTKPDPKNDARVSSLLTGSMNQTKLN